MGIINETKINGGSEKMALNIFEYSQDKKKPEEKSRAVDVMSLLETMSELEEYTGTTESKIYEIYYEVKRQLRNAVVVETEKEEKKE